MSLVTARKRGNRWEYRFEGLSVSGKRKQFSKSGFQSKKEALDAGNKAYNEYRNTGKRFGVNEISVSDYLDRWFDLYVKAELKYNTQQAYKQIVENHLKPTFGDYALSALEPTPIVEFMNTLKYQNYSQSMLTGILTLFSSALDYAVEPLHYIPWNPAKLVKIPKSNKPKEELIILQPEEMKRILERMKGTRFFVPICLGYFCGLRVSEACGLTWDCVDLEKNEIKIEKQLVERGHGAGEIRPLVNVKRADERACWYFTEPKKESFRTIKFGQILKDVLLDEKKRQEENEEEYKGFYYIQVTKIEKDEKGKDIVRILTCQKDIEPKFPRVRFVCTDENGELTNTNTIRYASRIINKELLIKFNYHALRHTHATELIESGVNPKSVQTRLGHKNIETTLNTYVHDTEKMKDDAVSSFEKTAHGMNFLWSNRGQNSFSEDSEST